MLLDLIDKDRKNKGRTKQGTVDLFSLGIPDNNTRKEINSSWDMSIPTINRIICPVVSVSQ